MTKTITVAYINMYDEPDWELAKGKIGKWFATTEQGQWLRDKFLDLHYNIEPDGGMEPHYWIELTLHLEDRDATMYYIRWPEPWGIPNNEEQYNI